MFMRFLLLTVACIYITTSNYMLLNAKDYNHGIQIDSAKAEELRPGLSGTDVYNLLGSPNLIDNISGTKETWYYILEKYSKIMFFKPNYYPDSYVLKVVFDDNGLVSNIQKIDLRKSKPNFKFSKKRTTISKEGYDIDLDIDDLVDVLE